MLQKSNPLCIERGDSFTGWHPVLQPMRATCERLFDAGDTRAWDVLHALAVLNRRQSFSDGLGGEA